MCLFSLSIKRPLFSHSCLLLLYESIRFKNSHQAKCISTQSCSIRQFDFPVSSFFLSLQIRELVPESQAYMDLLAFERKLDQTIMRKRLDIQEALKRPIKVRHRFLRSVRSERVMVQEWGSPTRSSWWLCRACSLSLELVIVAPSNT